MYMSKCDQRLQSNPNTEDQTEWSIVAFILNADHNLIGILGGLCLWM